VRAASLAVLALALMGCATETAPLVGDYPGTVTHTLRDCDTGVTVETATLQGVMMRIRTDATGPYIDAACPVYLDGSRPDCNRIDGSTVILETVQGIDLDLSGRVVATIYRHREQSNGVCVDWAWSFTGE
jgi:hypothetical protein